MYTYIVHDIGKGDSLFLYIGDKVVAKEVIVITTDGRVVRCNINSTAVQPQHDAPDPN